VGGKGSLGKGIDGVVHSISSMGTCPGEAQGVGVCMDEVENGLEKLEVGDGGRGY
jgi:hypothetical protein